MTPTLSSVLWLVPAVAVFLLPGWALTRRVGGPLPAVTTFLGSAAILFLVALALNAIGAPLHAGTVGAGLCVTAVLILRWRGLKTTESAGATITAQPAAPTTRWTWLWFVPPALVLASISVRAVIDPLSGYDNGFRWDYLARLILAHQSLGGYPPATAADYEFYSWCDGIPPLISLFNFWTYAATGSVARGLTAPRVIAEAVLVGVLVYRYAQLLWGPRAGRLALATLSSSALAVWSVAMGQETGTAAVAVIAMLYFLELNAKEPRTAHVLWAAVSAGVAAVTRDYTAIVPVLGVALLVARKAGLRPVILFAAIAGLISAPWYLRNWALTGNPLFPQTLGIFRGLPVYDELMRNVHQFWAIKTTPLDASLIPKALAVLTGIVFVAGAVGFAAGRRRTLAMLSGCIVLGLIWAYTMTRTGGGWTYSARILLPSLGLLAVAAGWLARFGRRITVPLLIILTIASADAARRSWLLPVWPVSPAWPPSFAQWRETRDQLDRITGHFVWKILAREAGGAGIVVDHPSHHVLITLNGGRALPLFSPLLEPTFNDHADFEAVRQMLRKENIRFVVISQRSPMGEQLVDAHPFWRELRRRYRPNSTVGILLIYDLQQPEVASR